MSVKMKVFAALLCIIVAPSCAFAADWSLQSTQTQSMELNDNQFLKSMLAGGTLGSYTNITANAEAKTHISRFNFDSDVTYKKYWGPGTEGVSQTEFLSDGFRAQYEITGKNRGERSYLEASLRQSSITEAVLNDLGITANVQGTLNVSTIRGGFDRAITHQDFVTLSAHSSYTSTDPAGAVPTFTDSNILGTWRHRLNGNLALTVSSEAEFLNYNNATSTRIVILRNNLGADATLSRVLSFRGSAGAATVIAEQSSSPTVPIGTPTSSSVTGFITDMLLTYKMFQDTTLTLSGNQSVAPSVIGSLTQSTSVRAGLAYTINRHSSLSLSASASRLTSSTTTEFYSGSVSYFYDLARDWHFSATYRHLHRAATSSAPSGGSIFNVAGIPPTLVTQAPGTPPADSNSLLLTISHSLTILPHGN